MAHSIKAAVKNLNDELFTPPLLVKPIIKYLHQFVMGFQIQHNREPIILCPFDLENSEFVLHIKEHYVVKWGHIDTGQDFFEHDYNDWDIAISNPPFSRKLDVFKRLDELGKPWVMVMNVMAWNYHEIVNYFINKEPELLMFDKRVSYNGKASSFGSCYVCRRFLPAKLICESLPHNNTGKNFVPSKMYKGD